MPFALYKDDQRNLVRIFKANNGINEGEKTL